MLRSRYPYEAEALENILATAPGARWPDRALVDVLEWGADEDAEGMPPMCVFSSNHKAAILEPDTLEVTVRKES